MSQTTAATAEMTDWKPSVNPWLIAAAGIGISLTTTLVARGTQVHQALMVGQLSPFRQEFQQYLQKTTRACPA